MQDIKLRLGEKIRVLREATGLSQEEFADKCDVGRAHMSLIERGKQNMTIETLVKITKHLHIPISVLFKEIGY